MTRRKLGRVLPSLLVGLLAVAAGAVAGVVAPIAMEPPQPALAWDNGLARTPPMGWNDWNSFDCEVTEKLVKETTDVMVAEGWRDAGYNYVNIDDCWSLRNRDSSGNIVADPAKFPGGMKALADYVHAKGMKFGIYADAGSHTCQGFPGSYGHEPTDAKLFASWDVDYIKYDNCNKPDGVDAVTRYRAMHNAIVASGRPMVLSICNWGNEFPWDWGPAVGNLWRTTGDSYPSWERTLKIFDLNSVQAWAAKPGAWNDPDMLEIGSKVNPPDPNHPEKPVEKALTFDESRTHFSLWAMMAAPLLAGADLRTLPANLRAIYLNRDVIALDQDPLGEQARTIYAAGDEQIMVKPLANGDRAVALFNRGNTQQTFSTTANYLSLPVSAQYTVTDLWSKRVTTTTGAISAVVKPHETVVLRVHADTPGQGGWTRSLQSRSGKCIDDPDSSVANNAELAAWGCHGAVNQQITYTAGKQLQIMGKCLDAFDRGTTPGTKVVLYTCNGQANQQWTVNANGTVVGVPSRLCLDIFNNEDANGTPIIIYTCKNADNQIWTKR